MFRVMPWSSPNDVLTGVALPSLATWTLSGEGIQVYSWWELMGHRPCTVARQTPISMLMEWFQSSARCRTAQQENMQASQHTAVAESPVCRHYLWLSAHPTSQGDVGRQQESQDQVRSRRRVQRDRAGYRVVQDGWDR